MGSARRDVGTTFLAYSATRPHLRAIDLPSGAIREVQARADNADAAFSHIWKREGWLALRSHMELWALPVPLSGKARLLLETWDTIPAEDGRTIWVQHPSGDCWTTCDQTGNLGSPRMARFENERLEAVFGDVALVREGAALRLRMAGRAEVDIGEAYAVVCQVGPHVVVTTELGATLDILDLVTGTRRRVERDGFGCWGLFASPSPDGSSIAIGCALAAAPKPRPPDVPLDEWLARLHDGRPLDDRNVMVFISAGDWTARIVTESFGNFAGLPAWTDDGAALTFAIPFENRVAWVAAEHPRRLDRVRTRLDPLLDATELVGRGIR